MKMHSIPGRLHGVLRRIEAAEKAFGRTPGSVTLVAVSKRHPVSAMQAAYEAGQRHFGENYVQEALSKKERLPFDDLVWHFIGRIQSNKTRLIAEHFDWVHSLDSVHHAERLSAKRPKEQHPLNLCVQINLNGESTRAGLRPQDAARAIADIARLPKLRLRGLMILPAPGDDFSRQRSAFRTLRNLRERLQSLECPLDTLSMGMSSDLEAAIAEGATLVRVGTAIFGPRGP